MALLLAQITSPSPFICSRFLPGYFVITSRSDRMDPTQPRQSGRPLLRHRGSKVRKTSRNPEYDVSQMQSSSSRYRRKPTGQRAAPLSQLNTPAGRALAEGPVVSNRHYGTPSVDPGVVYQQVRSRSRDAPIRQVRREREQSASPLDRLRHSHTRSKRDLRRAEHVDTGYMNTDRDLLPSQRPRSASSQSSSTSWGSSWEGSADCNKAAEQPPTPVIALTCPECGQSGFGLESPASFDGICRICRRFVPVGYTAPHDEPEQWSPGSENPPTPPPKDPAITACDMCLAIPLQIYEDFLRFFPTCKVCGHMTADTVADVVFRKGEVSGLRDDRGRLLLGPGQHLQDWCWCVAMELLSEAPSNPRTEHLNTQIPTHQAAVRPPRVDCMSEHPLPTAFDSMSLNEPPQVQVAFDNTEPAATPAAIARKRDRFLFLKRAQQAPPAISAGPPLPPPASAAVNAQTEAQLIPAYKVPRNYQYKEKFSFSPPKPGTGLVGGVEIISVRRPDSSEATRVFQPRYDMPRVTRKPLPARMPNGNVGRGDVPAVPGTNARPQPKRTFTEILGDR
ncbi:hypothetical protein BDV95DRAFT_38919 [Massariosphaeria phaeospora]|uniref:Uncharacterized protein n=1 Tax=Massariosphaeria phaeospora TaxID=100035 RepID=A0A7C8MB39_9PLEO|nr:hypothetical protein BDV95DRAFT_38919 [Massariosphaeria phaeospora]